MRGGRSVIWFVWPFAFLAGTGACKPATTAEKVEDKVEDAGHEIRQGAERAGKRIEKAAQ